jgi:hypothetical protein
MGNEVFFLVWAAKVFAKAGRVLKFYHFLPGRPAELDFEPYIGALITLCRNRRKGFGGVEDLREVQDVFEQVRSQKVWAPDALDHGRKSAARFERWLESSFPEALVTGR